MRARLKPPGDAVRCDVCGCAFVPESKTQREGEIEYSVFNCDYCGKAKRDAQNNEEEENDAVSE